MVGFNSFRGLLVYDLDSVLSITTLLVALTLILSSLTMSPLWAIVGSITFFVCITYLHIRRKEVSFEMLRLQVNPAVYLLLNIAFLLIFFYSIVSLYLRSETYVRPTSYFISTIFLVGILTVEILFLPSNKPYIGFVLSKIAIIPLSLLLSQSFLFPTVFGGDSLKHQIFTQDILNSGFIPEGFPYSKLPLMHLLTGETSLVTGLNYKMATLFSISSMQVILLVSFIFLLARLIFDAKIGLLAALLLGVSTLFIHWSIWAVPQTISAALIPAIIYILFKIKQNNLFIGSFLAILLMVGLITTHTVSSACMAILLVTSLIANKTFMRIYNKNHNIGITPVITIFFIVVMLAWWKYASGHIFALSKLIEWGFGSQWFTRPAVITEGAEQYIYNAPFSEWLFNTIGVYLFWIISLAGCFYMFSKKTNNPHGFSVAAGGLIVLTIVFIAVLFNRTGLLVDRWYYFSHILLSIPFAVSFFLFASVLRKDYIRILFIVTGVVTMSFLMIMVPKANMDNPLFKDSKVHVAGTTSEVQAIETVSKLMDNVWVNNYPGHGFTFIGITSKGEFSVDECFFTKDFSKCQNYVIMVNMKESQNRRNTFYRSFTKLDYNPVKLLGEKGFSCFYNSGSVGAFGIINKEKRYINK